MSKNKVQYILFFCLFICLVTIFYLCKRIYYLTPHDLTNKTKTEQQKEVVTSSYFHDRDKLFLIYPKDKDAIIFLGDSETNDFDWAEYFQNVHLKNRGIRGDNTKGVLNRLSQTIQENPQAIFLEIGINDLGSGIPVNDLINNYEKIVARLHGITELYLISIFPVADSSKTFPNTCSPEMNSKIISVNKQISNLSKKYKCSYIDVYKNLVDENHINSKYVLTDGLHLNGVGFLRWMIAISPIIKHLTSKN